MAKYDVYDRLFRYHTFEEYEKYCLFNALHHNHYKPFNCALIMAQRPGATLVQTEKAWKKKGYAVKPEASPIVIMQVGGPVTLVYDREDVCSTEPQLEAVRDYEPESPYENRIPLRIDVRLFTAWSDQVCRKGIRVAENRMGELLDGTAEYLEHPIPVTFFETAGEHIKEKTVPAYHQITLNSARTPHEKALALLHELGHLYCGHVAGRRTKENGLPDFRFARHVQTLQAMEAELGALRMQMLTLKGEEGAEAEYDSCRTRSEMLYSERDALEKRWTDQKEYEAQMVCKLLCERNGIADDMSDDYLRQHTAGGMLPDISLNHVLEAVEIIAGILDI